jgi:hypothetical protein
MNEQAPPGAWLTSRFLCLPLGIRFGEQILGGFFDSFRGFHRHILNVHDAAYGFGANGAEGFAVFINQGPHHGAAKKYQSILPPIVHNKPPELPDTAENQRLKLLAYSQRLSAKQDIHGKALIVVKKP